MVSLKKQIADKLRQDLVAHWKECDQCRDKFKADDLCSRGNTMFEIALLAGDSESILKEVK